MKLEKAKAEKELNKQLKSEGPTKEELVRMKFEEELAKKAKKQQEHQEKLDKLYQKMSEGPCTDQRAASPPIPALRNKAGPPRSPPIPTLRQKQTTEMVSPLPDPRAIAIPHSHQLKPQDTVSHQPKSQDTVTARPRAVPNIPEEQSPVVRVSVQPSVDYQPPQRSSSPVQIIPVTTNPVRSNFICSSVNSFLYRVLSCFSSLSILSLSLRSASCFFIRSSSLCCSRSFIYVITNTPVKTL